MDVVLMKSPAELAEKIKALSPSNRLRFAADLMDAAAHGPDDQKTRLLRIVKQMTEQTSFELGQLLFEDHFGK
jgi:hypothetical protein